MGELRPIHSLSKKSKRKISAWINSKILKSLINSKFKMSLIKKKTKGLLSSSLQNTAIVSRVWIDKGTRYAKHILVFALINYLYVGINP